MKEEKHKENIKSIEKDLYTLQVDLKATKSKLKIAYDYESELSQRMVSAKENTDKLQLEYHERYNKLTDGIQKLKDQMDLYTQNYLNNYKL